MLNISEKKVPLRPNIKSTIIKEVRLKTLV